MGGLLLKLQNFKKVKLIFGHPVPLFVNCMLLIALVHVCIVTNGLPDGSPQKIM